VYEDLDGKVYQNDLYKRNRGIFFCKSKYFEAKNREEVIKDIKTLDYSNFVYLEDLKTLDFSYEDKMSCSVSEIKYSPNKIIYRYVANSDGILTFPEAYDKDWSVTVNGKKTDLLRTNLIFRGVGIKEGKGEIVFKYRISKFYQILVFVGLLALMFLVSLYVYSKKFKKNDMEKNPI